ADPLVPTIMTRCLLPAWSTANHQPVVTAKTALAAISRVSGGSGAARKWSHDWSAEPTTTPAAVPVAAAKERPMLGGTARRAASRHGSHTAVANDVVAATSSETVFDRTR